MLGFIFQLYFGNIVLGIIAGFRTAEEQNYIYNSQASKCDG